MQVTMQHLTALWATMKIDPKWTTRIQDAVKVAITNKARYVKAAGLCRVPWWVIAACHMRESNADFTCHLHNGDPMADKYGHWLRTVQEPAGRPPYPPENGRFYLFEEESCVDAMDNHCAPENWSINRASFNFDAAGCLYFALTFNGEGAEMYHNEDSGYLWSGTDKYSRGKYKADGKWDPNLVDAEVGCAAFFKALAEQDPGVKMMLGGMPAVKV